MADPGDDAGLPRRIAREQLRLMSAQIARLPLVSLLVTSFLVWIASRIGLTQPALAWGAVFASLEFGRWGYARRVSRRPPVASPERGVAILNGFIGVLGVLRGLYVPLVFSRPVGEAHYVFTMVFVGLAAGSVATAGGDVKPYALWATAAGLPLGLAWLVYGGPAGGLIGALVLLLLLTLGGYVRDQGRMLRQLVNLAHEKEQLAESLRVERDRAHAASDSKTRFFAAASHDLRQPLHALSINATTLELLARRLAEPTMKELSQSIGRALRQSNALLDSLLDISMLEANVVEVRLEPVRALALLQSLREEYAPAAAQRGLTLAVEPAPGAEALWIETDPKQLRRVLGNLVGNAIKFTRRGGVRLTIAPGAAPRRCAIAVIDTGPGIAPQEHERVFEDFYQLDNPSRDRSQGLGLGLSIVRRTAALLGIEVKLDSAPGAGARFDVIVPCCDAPAQEADERAAGADVAEPGAPLQLGARVLAIDDEAEILDSLAAMLPLFGCEVRCAGSLAEALAVLDAGYLPQVLLVDKRLKGESGLQVIEALRERLGPVPAVIVTGDTAVHELHLTAASGARVIHKPIDGRLLAQALRDALDAGAPAAAQTASAPDQTSGPSLASAPER